MAGSIARQNSGSANSTTSAATSWASGQATVGADLLLIVQASNVLSGAPAGYTQRASAVNNADFKVYTRTGGATGNASDTPTISLSASGNILWWLIELGGTSGFDVVGTVTNSGSNATSQACSATPTAGNRFAIAILGQQQGNAFTWTGLNPSWTNSFVANATHPQVNGGGAPNDAQRLSLATLSANMTATSQSTTMSGVDSSQLNTVMIIFAEAAASPTGALASTGSSTASFIAFQPPAVMSSGGSSVASFVSTVGLNRMDFVNDVYWRNGTLASGFAAAVSAGYVSFTRAAGAGLAYYWDGQVGGSYVGTAGANTLRRGSRGALIEPAATNLAQQSKTVGSYTLAAMTVTANLATAPDGTATEADAVIQTATTAVHSAASPTYLPVPGFDYCASAFFQARAGAGNFVQLALPSAGFGANAYINFDCSTGTVGTVGSAVVSFGVEQYSSAWWRVWITAPCTTASSGGLTVYAIQNLTSARGPSFAGSTGNSFYLWGGQLELARANDRPTQFITTVAAAATRDADVLSIIPQGIGGPFDVRITFDDNSTQEFYRIGGGVPWAIPTNLNRDYIKYIDWFPSQQAAVGLWDFTNDTYNDGRGLSASGFANAVSAGLATFARASAATYTDGSQSNNLQVFATGTLRRGIRGALLEPTALNMSGGDTKALNNYTLTGATVTSNTTTSPEGTATEADRLVQTATSAVHSATDSSKATVQNQVYITSFYVASPAGAGNLIQLPAATNTGGTTSFANFDLSTKTWGTIGSNVLSYGYEIINATWTRIWHRYPCLNSALNNISAIGFISALTDARLPTFTGATANTVVVWGGQTELDTPDGKPSSVMHLGATTSRPADALTITLPAGTWDVQITSATDTSLRWVYQNVPAGAWAVPTGLGSSYIWKIETFLPGVVQGGALATGGSSVAAFVSAPTGSSFSMGGSTTSSFVYVAPRTYYFATAGSDSNDGLSTGSPKKTIAAANALVLNAGDTVLFNGGDTFAVTTGTVGLSLAAAGLKVGSYGTGQAIIDVTAAAVGCNGIYTEGPNVTVDNIKVVGRSFATATGRGISVWAYTGDHGGVNGWKVTRCIVDGFMFGISMGSDSGNKIDGAVIGGSSGQGNTVLNSARGIEGETNVNTVGSLTNFTASYNIVHDCRDFGIDFGTNLINGVNGALVERNTVYNIDLGRTAVGSGGAAGIICWAGTNITIRDNEVYGVHATSTGIDGIGVDIECAATVVVERNYCHDCGGPALMRYDWSGGPASSNCAFRFNLGVGCATEAGATYGFMMIGSAATATATNDNITQNTFVATSASTRTMLAVNNKAFSTAKVANNIFIGNGTVTMTSGAGSLGTVDHNTEYNISGSTLGTNVLTSDPKLTNFTGTAPTMTAGVWDPTVVNGYRLQTGSPALDAGVDLSTLGITQPSTDFFGNTLGTLPTNLGFYDGAGISVGSILSSTGSSTASFGGVQGLASPFATSGLSTANFVSQVAIAQPFSSTGSSTASFGGNKGLQSPLSSSGSSTASFVAISTATAALATGGSSTGTFAGSKGLQGQLATGGSSIAAFVGASASVGSGALSATGSTTGSFVGAGAVGQPFSMLGTSTGSFASSATKQSPFATAGSTTAAFTGVWTVSQPFTSSGSTTVQFASAAQKASPLATGGSSTASFAGQAAGAGVLASTGSSTTAFTGQGASQGTGAIASTGSSTASFVSTAQKVSPFTASGSSTGAFVGQALIAGTFAMAGTSTASFALVATASMVLSTSGASLTTFAAAGSTASALSSTGNTVSSFVGAAATASVLATAGLTSVAFVGSSAVGANGVLNSAGTGTAQFTSRATAASVLSATGTTTASFAGQMTATAALATSGSSLGSFQGASLRAGQLSASAASATAFVGTFSIGANTIFNSGGTGTVQWQSRASAASVLNSTSFTTVVFAGRSLNAVVFSSGGRSSASFVSAVGLAATFTMGGVGTAQFRGSANLGGSEVWLDGDIDAVDGLTADTGQDDTLYGDAATIVTDLLGEI